MTTVGQVGLWSGPDAELLSHASLEVRVLVTHDSDFLRLYQQHHQHTSVAYCRPGTRTIGDLVASLVLIFELLEAEETDGRVESL